MQLTSRAPSPLGLRSEVELVARARAGDDRAFEHLYARYRERIHAFILAKVRDHGRAEDLGQEVFMSALRQLRANDSEIAFKPWLYTIARNACIDEFRRGARAREVSLESEDLLLGSGTGDRMQSRLPTPPAAIESKQSLEDLRSAFDGLTDSQHKLLVMREFEGLTYEEIGARMGMTRPMVESGLFRARRKLGEEYDELTSGRRCEQVQSAIDAGELRSARGLGIKLRRRYGRHLAHCQPCRHVAMVAGVDDALLRPRSIADKVAGLLPLPVLRRLLSGRRSRRLLARAGHGAGQHAAGGLAGGAGGAGAGAAGLGAGQAAALAALVLGGTGGGLAMAEHATSHRHPAGHQVASIAPAGGSRAGSDATPLTAVAGAVTRHPAGARHGGRLSRRGSVGASLQPGGAAGGGPGPGTGAGSSSGTGAGGGSGSGRGTQHRTTTGAGSTSSGTEAASTGAGSGVKGVTRTVHRTASGAGTTVHKVTSGVGTAVQKTTSGVGTTVQRTASGVGTTVQQTASGVGTTVKTTVSGVGTTVQKVASGVGASGVGTTVRKTTSGVGSTVQKTTSSVGTAVDKTVSGAGTTAGTTASGVGTTVQQAVSGLTGGSASGTSTTTSSTTQAPTLLRPSPL